MKERHWTNLVSTVRHGECVLVLGPEVPAEKAAATALPSDAGTYADALRLRLSRELEEDGRRVSATSLAGVAQQYEDADDYGSGALRSQTAKFYSSRALEPSTIHRMLSELPFPLILSTCHDHLLADALKQAGKSPESLRYNMRGDRAANPEFSLPRALDEPLVYHLFGEFENPQSLVISENDLLDFLIAVISERPPIPNSLRRALRDGASMLFVGFGIRHWYLRVLLKALVRSLQQGASRSNFALEPLLHVAPEFEREQTILFYQRGTRVEVSDMDVEAFLVELQRRVQAEGGVVVDAMLRGAVRPRVFISYASEDRPLATRLFGALRKAGFDAWLDQDALGGGQDWNETIEEHLRDAEFVLVLDTPALVDKRVGYVNKEIALARDRAQHFRGSFLIPLWPDGVSGPPQVEELTPYQHLNLRESRFDDDVGVLVSTLRREYQRRQR